MVPDSATKILDVGCSNGALGRYLCSSVPGRSVFGIEFNEEFCEIAKHHLDDVLRMDLNREELVDAFPGHEFDCIVFGDVLEHLISPPTSLEHAVDKLAPNGCIIVSMPNIRHLTALYNIFISGTFPRKERGIFDRTHLRWFTISDARQLIEDAGLEVKCISYSLRLGDKGDGLLNKLLRRIFGSISSFYPIREFLAYQYCIIAKRPSSITGV
jgi:SAM-dependent methyltransferase